jgi:hypothetical protein
MTFAINTLLPESVPKRTSLWLETALRRVDKVPLPGIVHVPPVAFRSVTSAHWVGAVPDAKVKSELLNAQT